MLKRLLKELFLNILSQRAVKLGTTTFELRARAFGMQDLSYGRVSKSAGFSARL